MTNHSKATESKILYQETNPYASFTAFLEDDGRTIYLYVQSQYNSDWKMRSLWIRNTIPAPEKRDDDDFSVGLAPILLKDEVMNPNDVTPWDPKEISFLWSPQGTSVGVFYKEELVAFLPPWWGIEGIHGYSKECAKETFTAQPLGNAEHGVIKEIIDSYQEFWEKKSVSGHWKEFQTSILGYLEKHLGDHDKYWSADGGKYPSLAIASFHPEQFPGIRVFTTIGMSAQFQPEVEIMRKDWKEYSQIELVLAVKIGSDGDKTENWVPHLLGEMIKYPWNMGIWFGEGHMLAMNRKDPEQLYLDFTAILMREWNPSEEFFRYGGNPVRFLSLIPISEEEKLIYETEGSSSLKQKLIGAGISFIHDSERKGVF